MAAPLDPSMGAYPGQDGQSQQIDGTDPSQAQAQASAPAQAGGRKKRAYAGQAFDIGAGANTVPPSQSGPAPAQYGGAPQAPGYGYPAQDQAQTYQQPGYGDPQQTQAQANPQYPSQQSYDPQGGYQPAPSNYDTNPASSLMHNGVAPVTQQFAQMGLGGQQQSQMAMPRLNALQPVDISMQGQGQPFQASDLDNAPPPLILPPNVN